MSGQAHEPTTVLDSPTPERTRAIAVAVARLAKPGDLIGLVGELGAGKTHFVRGLAEGLGIDPDHVSSPTFVLMQEYEPGESTAGSVLVHVDAYRLRDPAELATLGWGDVGEALRENAVVAVEWADHVRDAMGADWLEIALEHADAGRRLTLTPHGDWAARIEMLEVSPR